MREADGRSLWWSVPAEAVRARAGLLPWRGVTWEAESEELILATWDVPPERPRLRLRIDAGGAVRTASVMRRDDGRHGASGT